MTRETNYTIQRKDGEGIQVTGRCRVFAFRDKRHGGRTILRVVADESVTVTRIGPRLEPVDVEGPPSKELD